MAENVVGEGSIELTPTVDRAALAKFSKQMQNALRPVTRKMNESLKLRDMQGPGPKAGPGALKGIQESSRISKVMEAENAAFKKLSAQREKHYRDSEASFKKHMSEGATFQDRILGNLRKNTQKMLQEKGFQAGQAQKMASLYSDFARKQYAEQLRTGTGLDKLTAHANEFSNTMAQKYAPALNSASAATQRAGSSFSKLGQHFRSGSISSGSFATKMKGVSSSLGQTAQQIGMTGFQIQMTGQQLTTFVTAPLAGATIAMAKFGITSAASLERAAALMESVVGSRGKAVEVLKGLTALAVKSPIFETGPLVEWSARMVGAGLAAKEVVPTMTSLANVFQRAGVAPEQASDALRALSQMLAKGKITGEEFNRQFLNAVPSGMQEMGRVAKIMSEKMGVNLGKTKGTVVDMGRALIQLSQDGKVSMTDIMKGFKLLGQTPEYMAAGIRSATTLTGVWQSLKESLQLKLGQQFLDPNNAFKVRPEIVEGLVKLQKALSDLIDNLGSAGVFDAMITGMTKAITMIGNLIKSFGQLTDAQKQTALKTVGFTAALGPAMLALGMMSSGISTVLGPMSTMVGMLGKLGTAGGAWGIGIAAGATAAAAGFIYLYKHSEEFRNSANKMANEFKLRWNTWIAPAIEDVRVQIVMLGQSFAKMGVDWKMVGEVGVFMIKMWAASLSAALKIVQVILVAVRGIIAAVMALVGWIAQASGWLMKLQQKVTEFQTGKKMDSNRGQDMQDWGKALNKNAESMLGWETQMSDMTPTTDKLSGAVSGLAGAFGLMGEKATTGMSTIDGLGAAVDALRQKMQMNTNAVATQIEADDALIRAKNGVTESVKQNGNSLAGNTVKAVENRVAMRDLIKASYDKMLVDIKSGVPMNQAIARHKARTVALEKEYGKSKENKAALDKLIKAYGKVPANVSTLLKMIGYKDVSLALFDLYVKQQSLKTGTSAAAARRKALKSDPDWAKQHTGSTAMATGGILPGYTPGKDVHMFTSPTAGNLALSGGEPIMRPEFGRAVGNGWVNTFNRIARTGGVNGVKKAMAQYASGGTLQIPMPIDVSQTQVKKSWADVGAGGNLLGGGGAAGGPGGYQKMFAWIKSRMPGVSLASGYRPGAWGYHGVGRATDLTFSDGSERRGGGMALQAFNLIKGTFMKNIKELIWDFAGSNAVWNGSNHLFYGPTSGPGTHNDHIHWAMDNGGWYNDGETAINTSGKPELNLNAAQAVALEDRIRGDEEPPVIEVYVGGHKLDNIIDYRVKKHTGETVQGLRRRKG